MKFSETAWASLLVNTLKPTAERPDDYSRFNHGDGLKWITGDMHGGDIMSRRRNGTNRAEQW